MVAAVEEWALAPSAGQHRSALSPVMVIDSQPLVRAGLVSLLESHFGRGSVTISTSTVRETILTGRHIAGSCAILGTRRGDATDRVVESIATLAMHGVDVLVLVDDPCAQSFEAATLAGAKGYLDKEASPAEFIRAVRLIATGRPCPPAHRLRNRERVSPRVRLSDQERRVLVLYVSGLTQDVVARRLGIAPNTVKHYLDRVRDKYNTVGVRARTKLELHALARTEGLIP